MTDSDDEFLKQCESGCDFGRYDLAMTVRRLVSMVRDRERSASLTADELVIAVAERDEARAFATNLSLKAGCWEHGDRPSQFCPYCGAMGAVVARAEKAEAEVARQQAQKYQRVYWSAALDRAEKAEAEVARLNQMLRDTGYGQGQIDAYAAQCEEIERLRRALREAAQAEKQG